MRPIFPALFLAAAPLAAVDPGLIDLVGPDANFVLGVRVSAIAESPLLRQALSEAQSSDAEWGGFLGAMGEDPLEGLEELLVLGRIDSDKDGAKPDGLVLARGDFQGDRWQKAFCSEGCTQEGFGAATLFHARHEGEEATFVKLSARYAAAGRAHQVKALLERRGSGRKPELATELNAWVRGLDQHHIWLAAKGPFEAPASEGGGPPIGRMVEDLKGFGLGVTLGDDVQFGLQVEADSEQAAEELHMMTQGLLMMFSAADAGEDGEPNEAAALLESLRLRREGGRVFADLRIPAEQLEGAVRSGLTSDEAPGEESAVQAQSQPAPPRSKGPIRIYGLSEEPIEVGAGQP